MSRDPPLATATSSPSSSPTAATSSTSSSPSTPLLWLLISATGPLLSPMGLGYGSARGATDERRSGRPSGSTCRRACADAYHRAAPGASAGGPRASPAPPPWSRYLHRPFFSYLPRNWALSPVMPLRRQVTVNTTRPCTN